MQKLGVTVAMLSIFLSASADGFEVNGISYNITDPAAKEVEVTNNTEGGYSGEIVVPSLVQYEGVAYTVTAIGNSTFSRCNRLTSITIPNSVTSIGAYAFSSCDGLTTITIPNSVTSIGVYAFDECDGLTSVTISNSVTTIGESTFFGCDALTSITIPNSVRTIGDWAFSSCDALTTITIPNTVTTIGDETFSWCRNLTSITIPNSVTSIGDWTFSGCSSLTNIEVADDNQMYSSKDGVLYNKSQTTLICCPGGKAGDFIIPNSVTTVVTGGFLGCSSLTNIDVDIENQAYSSIGGILYNKSQTTLVCCPGGKTGDIIIPNTVTTIGDGAFAYCIRQTSINIPNTVTTIGEGAFSNCIGLTSVTIPNSVTTIGEATFFWCGGLTSITIPNSVRTIGADAFGGCIGLTSITSLAVTPPECGYYVFEMIDKQGCTLYVPVGSVDAYKQAPEWKEFDVVKEAETGIDSIEAGTAAAATEVFNLAGVKVADTPDNLPAGIYIVREGSTSRKIVVR